MNKTHARPSSAGVSHRVGGRLSSIVGSLGSVSALGVAESLRRAEWRGVQHPHLDCAKNLGKAAPRCLYLRGPGFWAPRAGREAGPGREMWPPWAHAQVPASPGPVHRGLPSPAPARRARGEGRPRCNLRSSAGFYRGSPSLAPHFETRFPTQVQTADGLGLLSAARQGEDNAHQLEGGPRAAVFRGGPGLHPGPRPPLRVHTVTAGSPPPKAPQVAWPRSPVRPQPRESRPLGGRLPTLKRLWNWAESMWLSGDRAGGSVCPPTVGAPPSEIVRDQTTGSRT